MNEHGRTVYTLASRDIGAFHENAPDVIGTFADKTIAPEQLDGFYGRGQNTLPTVNIRRGSFGDSGV